MYKKVIRLVTRWIRKVESFLAGQKSETGVRTNGETLLSELQDLQQEETQLEMERDLATIQIGEEVLKYLSQQYWSLNPEDQKMTNKMMISLAISKTLQEMKKAEDRVTQNSMKP